MAESFNHVKKLIKTEQYKDYKKDYWGGCDVVIVSEIRYKEKNETLTSWKEKSECRKLVKTKYASSIIWLIENLKPYINCDYLDKYEYYNEIADFINQTLKGTKTTINEKELLYLIVSFLEKHEPSWEKTLDRKDLDKNSFMNWYSFGIEHNDPFFVKFVALWMAFNEQYNSMPGRDTKFNKKTGIKENITGVEHKKIDEFCDKYSETIESIHDLVFSSEFVKIFKNGVVKDMKNGSDTKYNRKNFEDLTNKKGIQQSKALLQTIYQVRCNLFHGSKSPDDKRDIELVRCSGEIMEMYMKAIMKY